MKFAVCAVLICNFRNSRFHRLCDPFAYLSVELSLYRDSSAEPGQLGSSRQHIWEYLLTLRELRHDRCAFPRSPRSGVRNVRQTLSFLKIPRARQSRRRMEADFRFTGFFD